MITRILQISTAAIALAAVSCSSGIDMPKGTSKGHSSVRLVRSNVRGDDAFVPNAAEVHRMMQKSLAAEFQSKGMNVDRNTNDLIVGYMILVQDNNSTLALDDYFGQGRSSAEISDRAHTIGVIKNERPDVFEAGTIVVDVIDAQTNKLVFRNYATRDIFPNLSKSARQQRVNEAVAEAMQPFWR